MNITSYKVIKMIINDSMKNTYNSTTEKANQILEKNLSLEDDFIEKGDKHIRWSWACRILDNTEDIEIESYNIGDLPNIADLGLFKVLNLGHHKNIITADNKKMRLYQGDLFVGVFGNRYATDAYEGEIEGLKNLSLLTAAGMVGTIKSKNKSMGNPSDVLFLGFLKDVKTNQRINLKRLRFKKYEPLDVDYIKNILVIIGSGMNSGKTTACRKLIKSFSGKGFKIAACKLTGSVSNRDQDEMLSASPLYTIDFSDYGFPSTYKCELEELLDLFKTMIYDIKKFNPRLVIMEIADGILQRETRMILNSSVFQRVVKNVIVTADSAPSALYTTEYLQKIGYNVIAVSGAITSSPLYMKEFEQNSNIPIISSADHNIRLHHFKGLIMKN
jgi:hypothetical protein